MKARVCAFLLCAAVSLVAQRTLEDDKSVVSQVRIDARDLGYPPIDVIPSGESAITGLSVAPNGFIYGVTSGKKSHLFLLDPLHGYVQPLGFLKDVTNVPGSLTILSNGDVYIGGAMTVDNGGSGYETYAGGHLLRYRPPSDQESRPIRVDIACDITDLGVPAGHESIYALTADRERNILYGLTYPSGTFFRYDISDSKFTLLGKVAEHRIHGEKFERDRLIGRAVVVDAKGNVFMSGENGALFCYRPGASSIEKLAVTVPAEPGREGYNRIEVWSPDTSGAIYGGTSDGYLIRFHPDSMTIDNLGKPLNQYRVNGLVVARNGKLYGVGGDVDDMCRLFSYDPNTGTYQILGFIDVNRRPYYSWQAYQIGAMCLGADGTIYLGESERRSRLYLYYPQ